MFLIASQLGKLDTGSDGKWTSKLEPFKDSADKLAIYHSELLMRTTTQLTSHSNGTSIISDAKLVRLLNHPNIATRSLGGLVTVIRSRAHQHPVTHYRLPKQATNTDQGFVVHGTNDSTTLPTSAPMSVLFREFTVSGELVKLAFPVPVRQSDRDVQEAAQSTLKSVTIVLSSEQSSRLLSGDHAAACYDSAFVGINLTRETTIEGQVEHLVAEALAAWPWDLERAETTQTEDLLTNQILSLALLFTLYGDLTPKNLEAADDIIQLLFEQGSEEIKPAVRSALWRLIKGARCHCALQKKSIYKV